MPGPQRYSADVLAEPARRRRVPEVAADAGLVVETADGNYCGAVVALGQAVVAGERRDVVTLEDRRGRRREFALLPAAFLLDGQLVTLTAPAPAAPQRPSARARTASGSFAVAGAKARVARGSRIWVEGIHDAALVERVWGDDLRLEGVVVEPLSGIDELAAALRSFGPGAGRRVGVLVDHLIPGTKEARIVAGISDPHVLVTGHPYVDIWQAVKPAAVGIAGWPTVPRGLDWKSGVCQALGIGAPREMWRRVLAAVDSFADVEAPLLRAVEELIDFVTAGDGR
ncbi:MAG: DUF3097 domain-containing protein [Actinobacteria bacterium]|nr:DUF3097 domain-containing protein [Actinomycetota bacterium]